MYRSGSGVSHHIGEDEMRGISRRDFGKLAGAAGAGALTSAAWGTFAIAQGAAKVVIVGGGAGGATVAHFVKKEAPNLDVTLIEANPIYSSSFFSNLYIGGFRTLEFAQSWLRRACAGSASRWCTISQPTSIRAKKTVQDAGRPHLCLRSAGAVAGHRHQVRLDQGLFARRRRAPCRMPTPPTRHRKRLLKQQLQNMRDGGTVAMVMPNNPFRCPPGPYERACMIAHYLKTRKPKSKLVILDPKRAFSKQPVFVEAFDKYYKGIIELNLSTEIDDFAVVSVDPKTKEIVTKAGKKVRADVANIIPQQRAGEIAAKAGINEGDWCPVNPENFSSKKVQDIYVLGDAAIAAEMPKSAFSANSQAKVVAADIAGGAGQEGVSSRPAIAIPAGRCWRPTTT